MSGRKGERSKNDTWGERELAKYIGRDQKQKTTDAHGSAQGGSKDRSSKGSGIKPPARSDKGISSSRKNTGDKETASPLAGRKTDARSKVDGTKKVAEKPRGPTKPGGTPRQEVEKSRESSRQRDGSQKRPGAETRPKMRAAADARSGTKVTDPRKPARAVETKGRESTGDAQKPEHRQQPSDRRSGKERRQPPQQGVKEKGSQKATSSGQLERGREGRGKEGSGKLLSSSSSSLREQEGEALLEREKQKQSSEKKDKHKEELHQKIRVSEDPPVGVVGEGEGEGGGGEEGGSVGGQTVIQEHPQVHPMKEVTDPEEIVEDYQYEDDEFEDYEEDFDEELESTGSEEGAATPTNHTHQPQEPVDLVAIMQAIDAENKLVGMGQTAMEETAAEKEVDETAHTEGRVIHQSPSRAFIDFSAAQQREVREKVAKKTRKRGQELLTMIELDIVAYDMFDLPPLTEYELYIKNFGSDDCRQVSTQTGEDNREREAQTEEILVTEKWVQWPPEDLKGYGGSTESDDDRCAESSSIVSGHDAVRLTAFLKKAGQVCSMLLEENVSTSGQSPFHSTQSSFPFCSSCLQIQTLPSFLTGRFAGSVEFCPTQDHLVLAAYSSVPRDGHHGNMLGGRGIVCLWNTRQPTQPHHVLVCESTPTCCCFSPRKASLVFAGNEDGSVVLWDLREPLSLHTPPPSSAWSQLDFIPRTATFSTAGIPSLDNHKAPLVTITSILTEGGGLTPPPSLLTTSHDEEEDSTGLSFQLATLDRSGHLNVWVVVEIYHPDPHGSESDLGLAPGGRVKLVKSASLDIWGPNSRTPSVMGSVHAFCLQFHPQDANHLYIGTDMGSVYHHTRYGKRPIPKYYTSNLEREDVSDVISLSFSPWQPDHFLVGCSDGSIRLHCTKRAAPLVTWLHSTNGVAVRHVQWVEHQPGTFLILDSHSTLYVWDLLKNDAEPQYKEQMKMSVSCCRLSHPSSPQHTSSLLLSLTNGTMEVHHLTADSSRQQKEQLFQTYLDHLL